MFIIDRKTGELLYETPTTPEQRRRAYDIALKETADRIIRNYLEKEEEERVRG